MKRRDSGTLPANATMRLVATTLLLLASACHRHEHAASGIGRVEQYIEDTDLSPDDSRLPALRSYGNGLAQTLSKDMSGAELSEAALVVQQRSTCMTGMFGHKAHAHVLALQNMLGDTPETHRRLLTLLSEAPAVELAAPDICNH